ELLQGRSLKDLDVFNPPSFDDEEVGDHTNLETHFIDSSGLISWDLFKKDADYPFVDWDFSGSTEEEFHTLMSLCQQCDAEVYIMDYNHLGVYACRILVPGLSDIYPAEDLQLANNIMGVHWRDTILSLPTSHGTKEEYLSLIGQFDEDG
ncbi:YcaO-like family protein, partial [Proteus mirabilis]